MKKTFFALLLSGASLLGQQSTCLPLSLQQPSQEIRAEMNLNLDIPKDLGLFERVPVKVENRLNHNLKNEYNPQSMLGYMRMKPEEIRNAGRNTLERSTEQAFRQIGLDVLGYEKWRGDIKKFVGDMFSGDEERNGLLYSRFNFREGVPGTEKLTNMKYDKKFFNYGIRPFRTNPLAYVGVGNVNIGELQFKATRTKSEVDLTIPIVKNFALDGGMQRSWYGDQRFNTYVGISYAKKDNFWSLGVGGFEQRNPRLTFSYFRAL